MPNKNKILFLGRGVIAERCLASLLDIHSLQVSAICSNKNPNQFWWKSNEIYRTAKMFNLPFIDNKVRNEAQVLNVIKEHDIGTLISIQHTWILPEEALSLVCNRAYNLHNALLPDYKGFYTIAHEIANGEHMHCSTIHRMAPKVDTGDVLAQASQVIFSCDTAKTVFWKSVDLSVNMFRQFISRFACNFALHPTPIPLGGKFYNTADFVALKAELKSKKTTKARKARIIRALDF